MSVGGAKGSKGKVTAKSTSGKLVGENGNRQALYVSNPSAKEVWLALGSEAKKEEGIWLKKESSLVYPLIGYTGEVTLVTTEGEGTVTYVEV